MTDAMGKTETNTYDDANGLRLSSTDRNGQTFNYAYDGTGNMISRALSDMTAAEVTTYGKTGNILIKSKAIISF